jgi:hypothetical protein
MFRFFASLLLTLITLTVANTASADVVVALGKIISTQGHAIPRCRIVEFKENGTGTQIRFRIADDAGSSDIAAVILTAIATNRDVRIAYDPLVTTGCGTQPRISWVEVR